MARHWDFQLSTRVQFGRGGLKKLGEVARQFGTRALLVGYRDQTGLESAYACARKTLSEAGLTVVSFDEVPPDPDAELGSKGARLAAESAVDMVVGLGGGSVIDAAKGIALVASMGGVLWDYTGANPQCRAAAHSLPLVAVPTTAGTGSEVSGVAVFTHHGVGSQPDLPLKASISGPAIRPQVALVDPDLAVGSPPKLTAACGADALGHAIEACISRRANPISSTLAGQAVRLIVDNLARAVEQPDDPDPRESLALGSLMAGAAFGSAGVVVPHAISQSLGGVLHLPHGVGVALSTPLSLRFNAPECAEEYAELARVCGITADSPPSRAAAFVEQITALLKSVGLPDKIEVPDNPPRDLLEKLVRNAFDSTPVPIKLNPRKIDESVMRELFRELLP